MNTQTLEDCISRLEQMTLDRGDTWDLSPNDQDAIRQTLEHVAALRAVVGVANLALTIAVSWAGFTLDHWDSDRDHKVGKCLAAMNGRLPGYAPDTDAFHAYRKQVHDARNAMEQAKQSEREAGE